jgi:hypothetical protein
VKHAKRTINIVVIVVIIHKNNIQTIYFGINTNFVENGVDMIQSIKYAKVIKGVYKDKK